MRKARSSAPLVTTARHRARPTSLESSPNFSGNKSAGGELNVVWESPFSLIPHERNARKHSEKQLTLITGSIREFGFTNPVLTDGKKRILAGHGRVEAAKRLGVARVPTISITHLTPAQRRAYMLADNRIAELSSWDKELLAVELEELSALDLSLHVEVTGFSTGEIDVLMAENENRSPSDPDEVVSDDTAGEAVARKGDLWILGNNHRLFCSDALLPETYQTLMQGKKARVVFTDPPYNVPVQGHVGGLGRIRHAEFAMASGEMNEEQFIAFLEKSLKNLSTASVDGTVMYVCMDWRHMREMLAAGSAADLSLLNLCIWNKNNGGMGSFYRSKHELVFVFRVGAAKHINNIELGKHGRYRTNIWDYPGANTMRPGRLADLRAHPTVKPTPLVADAIRDCSRRGHIVLDAFAGSGTTILAAERTGRQAYCIEIEPRYVDVAIRRWQRLTGTTAKLSSGETFDQVALARGSAKEAE